MSDSHYNDQDAEEILRLASRDGLTGGMSRDKLLQTAAELGITPEAVQRAEEQIVKKREADRMRQEDELLHNQFKQERRRGFFNDLVTYVATNGFMVGIWWFTGGHYFWPMWVMLGWGLFGLAPDFFNTFFGQDEAKFQRWKRRRERKSKGSRDIFAEATPILDELATSGDDVAKLNAIKELRDRLGLDLRDAKEVVDEYEAKNPGIFA